MSPTVLDVQVVPPAFLDYMIARPDDVSQWPGFWTIARCNPQHWKAAERDIEQRGGWVWIPKRTEKRVYATQTRIVTRPLFADMLFVALQDNTYNATDVLDVSCLMDCGDQNRFARELRKFQIATSEKSNTLRLVHGLTIGSNVRIKQNAPHRLKGVEGILLSDDGGQSFVIQIVVLGASYAVDDVDPAWVEPLN